MWELSVLVSHIYAQSPCLTVVDPFFLVSGCPCNQADGKPVVPDGWMGLVVAERLMRHGATFLLLGLLYIAILGLTR
jgi:hypothetical protein